MEQELPQASVALIVGVTGMVGLSLTEALKKPLTPGGPWIVYGAARRPLPTWFPSHLIDQFIPFDATNYDQTRENLSPYTNKITHLFWLALQVRKSEEEKIVANSSMLENVLNVLLKSSPPSSLRHVDLLTGTYHYMGPKLDPVISKQIVPHEPPFQEDMPRLPCPNFYYALEDILVSYSPLFTHSVHRSSIILGASSRSIYNLILTIFVYAIICKHEGSSSRYPGNKYTWNHFADISDARILADQKIWAAVTDEAKNQAFNCTNGDYFTWKSLWKVVSEIFEVEFVPFDENAERFDWVEEMKNKDKVWDNIVGKYGLYKTKLDEITCFSIVDVTLNGYNFQPVCSMNKSR